MKSKKLANEIVDSGLDYALYQQPDAKKRIKAYRIAATEFNLLADQMEWELYTHAEGKSENRE